MESKRFLIGGVWTECSRVLPVVNPATTEVVANCSVSSGAHVTAAVEAAASAFGKWANTCIDERARLLLRFADVLAGHTDELCNLLTQEQGKPRTGYANMGGEFEVAGAISRIRATAGYRLPTKIVQDDEVARIEIRRKPLGVVASITPWNYPLLIAVWHLIPALLAGNTVVIKPSEYAPLTVLRALELLQPLLPDGVVNVLLGDAEVGEALVAEDAVAKVVFTGSTATGKRVMAVASSTVKRLTLELGGNDAAIVLPDVDVAEVAPKLFTAAMINNGQTCAALKRLYVHEDIFDEVCRALTEIAGSVSTGDGSGNVDFGPVQNKVQFDRVVALAVDARDQGGRFLAGGVPNPEQVGYFFPISIVAGLDEGARLVREEPFGPILPVLKFSDVDNAVERANASINGLGGSVWSSDLSKAEQIAGQLECGTVWINNHAALQPNVPFGGAKQSGLGVQFGLEGLEEFTAAQVIQVWKS